MGLWQGNKHHNLWTIMIVAFILYTVSCMTAVHPMWNLFLYEIWYMFLRRWNFNVHRTVSLLCTKIWTKPRLTLILHCHSVSVWEKNMLIFMYFQQPLELQHNTVVQSFVTLFWYREIISPCYIPPTKLGLVDCVYNSGKQLSMSSVSDLNHWINLRSEWQFRGLQPG